MTLSNRVCSCHRKYIQLLTEREETEVVPCDTVSVCDDVTTQTFRSSKNAKEKKGVQDSSRYISVYDLLLRIFHIVLY